MWKHTPAAHARVPKSRYWVHAHMHGLHAYITSTVNTSACREVAVRGRAAAGPSRGVPWISAAPEQRTCCGAARCATVPCCPRLPSSCCGETGWTRWCLTRPQPTGRSRACPPRCAPGGPGAAVASPRPSLIPHCRHPASALCRPPLAAPAALRRGRVPRGRCLPALALVSARSAGALWGATPSSVAPP